MFASPYHKDQFTKRVAAVSSQLEVSLDPHMVAEVSKQNPDALYVLMVMESALDALKIARQPQYACDEKAVQELTGKFPLLKQEFMNFFERCIASESALQQSHPQTAPQPAF